jgi:HK97 family phage major capsid protein
MRTSLRDILQRMDSARAEMRALNEAAAPDGTLSDEAQARWVALESEMSGLRAAEQRQATLDDLERRMAGQPIGGTGDAAYDRAFGDIGLLDVMRAQTGGTDARAMRARELSAEMERRSGRKAQGLLWDMRLGGTETRTLTSTTPVGGPGGVLIANAVRPDLFVDRLRRATVVRSLGARVIGGLTSNITIPRLATSVVAAWTPENTEFPVSDPEVNSLSMVPRHLGVITELSRNMIQQTNPDAEQLVRDDQAKVLAGGLDAAAIAGSGTGATPRGITNTVGVSTTAMGGGITFDAVADLRGRTADANVDGANTGFLGGTAVRRGASKLKDAAGNPLGLATVFGGERFAATNYAPTGTLVWSGAWDDLIIAFWSELDVLVNAYAEGPYKRGNIYVRTALTCDIGVRHPESFAVLTGIT